MNGPYRPPEDWYLELRWLPMHLRSLHGILEVRCEEWLSGDIASYFNRVIADRTSQDMGNRTEDRERVFAEQESGAIKVIVTILVRLVLD